MAIKGLSSTVAMKGNDIVLSLDIYGVIGDSWGDGITAKAVRDILKGAPEAKAIEVSINSPGGVCADGVAIYNQLKAHGAKITVYVDGEAASAASVVAMAGDEIVMREGTLIMIHNCLWFAGGHKDDVGKAAAVMAQTDSAMAGIYAKRTGLDESEVAALMDAETWMFGQEAVDAGFADRVEGEALELVACADASKVRDDYTNIPNEIKILLEKPPVKTQANDKQGGLDDARIQEGGSNVEYKDLTLEQLKAERPDLVESAKGEIELPDVDAAKEAALKAERERVAAIRAEAKELRLIEDGDRMEADGVTADAALLELRAKALDAYKAEGPENPGADGEEAPKPKSDDRLVARAKEIAAEKKIHFNDALCIAFEEGK